jgi:hypothetical protein
MLSEYDRAIINFYESLENDKEKFTEENWQIIEDTRKYLLKITPHLTN